MLRPTLQGMAGSVFSSLLGTCPAVLRFVLPTLRPAFVVWSDVDTPSTGNRPSGNLGAPLGRIQMREMLVMRLFRFLTLFFLLSDSGGGGGEADGAGDGAGGDGSGGAGDGAAGGDGDRTFTQAELNNIATKEHRTGAAKAMKDVAETLGMSVEDAKKLIDAQREAEDAAKSEEERAIDEARQAVATAQAVEAEARSKVLRSDLAIAFAGDPGDGNEPLNRAYLGPALDLAMPTVLAFEGDPADAVAAGIEYVRGTAPVFFGDGNSSGRPKSGTPGVPVRPGSQTRVQSGDVDPWERAQTVYNAHQENSRADRFAGNQSTE